MRRSKRESSEIGFAARKHTETDLRMQRSGQERTVVGFAERGHAATGGRNQDKRGPGPAKRTRRLWDGRRCTETGKNGPTDADTMGPAQEHRSKREGTEMGLAAWKQAETDLRMQGSGWERAVVGFAEDNKSQVVIKEKAKPNTAVCHTLHCFQ